MYRSSTIHRTIYVTHKYHARIPTHVRRDVDEPVPVLCRSSLGHRHALPVAIAVAGARHSLARSAGESAAADAKSGFPVRMVRGTNFSIKKHAYSLDPANNVEKTTELHTRID